MGGASEKQRLTEVQQLSKMLFREANIDEARSDVAFRAGEQIEATVETLVDNAFEANLSLPEGDIYVSYCLHKEASVVFTLDGVGLTCEFIDFLYEYPPKLRFDAAKIVPKLLKNQPKTLRTLIVSPHSTLWRRVPILRHLVHCPTSYIESVFALPQVPTVAPRTLAVCFADYAKRPELRLELADFQAERVQAVYSDAQVRLFELTGVGLEAAMMYGTGILHIIGHGRFNEYTQNSMDSGLETYDRESGVTGVIGLLELEHAVARSKLVILSSCLSGRGSATLEGLAGLPMAFRAKGIASMVSFTIEVHEDAAALVLECLHKFISKGLRLAEAVHGLIGWADALSDIEIQAYISQIEPLIAEKSDDALSVATIRENLVSAVDHIILYGDPDLRVRPNCGP